MAHLGVVQVGQQHHTQFLGAHQAMDRHQAVDRPGVHVQHATVVVGLEPAEAVAEPAMGVEPHRGVDLLVNQRPWPEQFLAGRLGEQALPPGGDASVEQEAGPAAHLPHAGPDRARRGDRIDGGVLDYRDPVVDHVVRRGDVVAQFTARQTGHRAGHPERREDSALDELDPGLPRDHLGQLSRRRVHHVLVLEAGVHRGLQLDES